MQWAFEYVSHVLGSGAARLSDRLVTLHSILLLTVAYVFSLALMYLFHSPFRAHAACRTDWYAQLTKLLQVWIAIVVVFFHVTPHFFGLGRRLVRSPGGAAGAAATENAIVTDEAGVAFVFFPIFSSLTMVFLLLHKVKRRFGLGVTYGPSFTVVLLNSVLLSVLALVHYTACWEIATTVQEKQRRHGGALDEAATAAPEPPANGSASPMVGYHLSGAALSAASVGLSAVCPTSHVLVRPFTTIAHLLLMSVVFIVADYRYKAYRGFDPTRGMLFSELYHRRGKAVRDPTRDAVTVGRQPQPTSTWWWQWWWWGITRNSAKLREAYRAYDFRYSEPKPVRATARKGPGQLRQGSSMMDAVASGSTPDARADCSIAGGREKVSFPLTAEELADMKGCSHPDNKSGMVPWFSTFILNTTWQAMAYGALEFLVFDVRLLQENRRPKVFNLQFFPKLSMLHAARRAEMEARQNEQGQQQKAFSSSSVAGALCSATARDTPTSVGSPRDDSTPLSAETFPCAVPALAEPAAVGNGSCTDCLQDVWFDWIADIGDGFNSTYEMARLLAKPVLHIQDIGKMQQSRASHTTMLPELWPSSRSRLREHEDAAEGSLDGRGEARSGGRRRRRARPRTPPASSSAATASQRDARLGSQVGSPSFLRGGEGKRSFSAAPPRLSQATAAQSGSPTGVGMSMSPSANDTAFFSRNLTASAPAELQKSTDGVNYSLPRGSFVLIGGDLAYPNPSDETFETRFIGPYNDALRGSQSLRDMHHEHRDEIVEPDAADPDMVHIKMLDAVSVSSVASGGGSLFETVRGTKEEALRSVPLMFAFPGNHEWLDGLSTFRKYIIERSWVGGWFMPQRTSYFMLKLPHNWFILCTDGGNLKDIDAAQRNYFMNAIEQYMDENSCVVLTSHEPGWIYDAMLRRDQAIQPELNALAAAIGTRLRMWLAGDIHHYSRHSPLDPTSEAPALVVSGGGGAFLHGPRRSPVIHQGTEYIRSCAFPHGNTYMSLASRLVGFRLINWKFDLIVGVCCFLVVMSMLPQPYKTAGMESIKDVGDFAEAWAALTSSLAEYIFSKAIISLIAVIGFFLGFSSAGVETGVPLVARAIHGALWTFLVVFACCSMLAYLECVLGYMANNGMLLSSEGKWGSVLDQQVRLTTDVLLNHTRELLGEETAVAAAIGKVQHRLYNSKLVHASSFVLRCLDPIETLAYFSVKVSSPGLKMGKISPDATRTEVTLYYLNFLFFYWILVTPLVSFLIGCFLLVSATIFDCLYDPAYSAFQIEDYKHFIRFRIDAATRELHGYVIAEKKVPKVWEVNPRHVEEVCAASSGGSDTLKRSPPPHLSAHPARWRFSIDPATTPWRGVNAGSFLASIFRLRRRSGRAQAVRGQPEVLEHFVCRPHAADKNEDMGSRTPSAT